MKKLVICIALLITIVIHSTAQTPQAISYQAVARNAEGQVIANTNVSLLISILSGSINGSKVYSERHSVTTNSFGLITLKIGEGQVLSGNFSQIDWSANSYFTKIEIDVAGGINYTEVGTSQMLAVPYAFYAEKAKTVKLTAGTGISIEGDTIKNTAPNENQDISISKDTIFLSKGGFVKLPSMQESLKGMPLGGTANVLDIGNNDYSKIIFLGSETNWDDNNEISINSDNSIYYSFYGNDGVGIRKYDVNGTLIWEKSVGEIANVNIAADASNNLYISGKYSESITIGSTTYTNTGDGSSILIKYNASGNILWFKNFQNTIISDIDCSSELFVVGKINGVWGSSPEKLLVLKYNLNGSLLKTKEIVGVLNSEFYSEEIKYSNNKLFWGITSSYDNNCQVGSITINKGNDAIVKLDLDLNPLSAYQDPLSAYQDKSIENFSLTNTSSEILLWDDDANLKILDINFNVTDTLNISDMSSMWLNDISDFNNGLLLSGEFKSGMVINETYITTLGGSDPIVLFYNRQTKLIEIYLWLKNFGESGAMGIHYINNQPYFHIQLDGSFYNKGQKYKSGNYLIAK